MKFWTRTPPRNAYRALPSPDQYDRPMEILEAEFVEVPRPEVQTMAEEEPYPEIWRAGDELVHRYLGRRGR
jgi:hypothetical protein